MKILFIAPQPFFLPRGTPIAVRAALEVLADLGHDIDLLCFHEGEDVRIPGVRIHRIQRPRAVRGRIPIGPSWQKLVCDIALWRLARGMLRANDYDILHGVEEGAFIAGSLSRRFIYDMDSEMSAQIAARGLLFSPLAWLFQRLERWAARAAVGVLAVCPALVHTAQHYRRGDNGIALLPDPPLGNPHLGGPDHAAPLPEIAGIPGLKLVYVGNLEPYQGVELMVRAFADLAAARPQATLVIVGGAAPDGGREAAALRQLAPHLFQAGRIRILGPRPLERLGEILPAADILISPRCAGRNTPMKIYSYLASGRPILATDLPTHTQVLSDGVALLAAPDPTAMSAAMRRLIDSPDLRRQLGDAGRCLAMREYSPEAFRRRLAAFYRHIEDALCTPSIPRTTTNVAVAAAREEP